MTGQGTIVNALPRSRWTDQISEGIGLLAREIDGRRVPAPDVIVWLAEWARDAWSEQRGRGSGSIINIASLSAHRGWPKATNLPSMPRLRTH